jgi:hypothetical protein
MKNILFVATAFFSLCFAAVLQAQTTQTIFTYLTPTQGIDLTMETNLTGVMGQKKTKATYFPGKVKTAEGKVFGAEFRVRGRFRRRIAALPPMTIKFSKKDIKNAGYDTLNRIKLVLPTLLSPEGEDLIAREYLAYKMFESISTTNHVKGRFVNLTLRDTGGDRKTFKVSAILLEDEKETAARLSGTIVTDFGVPHTKWDKSLAALSVVFQYMIGNTDWDIEAQRNMRMVAPKDPALPYLIMPYDFDFAGLVNATYAIPSSESGLKNVKDRYLMAKYLSPEELRNAVQTLKAKREVLYGICKSELVSKSTIKEMTAYLDTFFKQVDQDENLPERLILNKK